MPTYSQVDGSDIELKNQGIVGIREFSTVKDLTCTLDTSAYETGDVLFQIQELTDVSRLAGGIVTTTGQNILVLDESDQGIAMDIIFFDGGSGLGIENAAVSISDVTARNIVGFVSIASTDYVDLGGCKIATPAVKMMQMKTAAGSKSLWVGAVARGAGTFSANAIKLKIGFWQA